MKQIIIVAITSFICFPLAAQTIKEPTNGNPQWSKPFPPFRIVGNLYYVGSYDLACYLIVTKDGNILINTGLAASAPMITQNIESLGFQPTETKILLTTQAHYDHVGAMAAIKRSTGAKMMVDEKDAGVLSDGGASDYEMGKYGRTYEPINADRILKNGDEIMLGDTRLVMLHHPGHTKGSGSFLLTVKDEHRTYKVLIANMPTIITDRKFSNIPSYPDIANDYVYTFDTMKKLSFDLWLSSHAGQFGLHDKYHPGDVYNPEAFADRKGYEDSLKELETAYLKKMAEK